MNKIIKKIFNNSITLKVVILLFLIKGLGFIKNVFFAKYFGLSNVMDAYQMASSIPTIFLGVVVYSYQAFTKGYFNAEAEKASKSYTSSFINFISLIIIVLSIVLLIFSKEIITLFAPGFTEETILITKDFLVYFTFGVIFFALSNILAEYLRCNDSFVKSQISNLLINIIEIVFIFISLKFGYIWLSIGFLIANFINFIVHLFIACRYNFKYYFCIKKEDFKVFIGVIIPVFISSIISEFNMFIDKSFSSMMGSGSVSTLTYSMNVRTVFLIIAAGYITVIFPKISKMFSYKKIDEFKKTISSSCKKICLIYIPLTLLGIIFSRLIIKIIYFRGQFDLAALDRTAKCFVMYAIGILGISLRDLYIKALYCINKGKFVTIFSVLSVVLNLIFNFIFSKSMGVIGLAFATSLSVYCVLPFIIIVYKNTMKKIIN